MELKIGLVSCTNQVAVESHYSAWPPLSCGRDNLLKTFYIKRNQVNCPHILFSFSKSWCGAHLRCFVAILKQNTGGVKRDDRGRYMIYAVLNYLLIFTDSVPCLCRSCNFGSFGFRPARSALLTPPEFEALRCLYFSSP